MLVVGLLQAGLGVAEDGIPDFVAEPKGGEAGLAGDAQVMDTEVLQLGAAPAGDRRCPPIIPLPR